jgi:hypothetical protein
MVASRTPENAREVVRKPPDEWDELRGMMTPELARIIRSWKTLPDGLKAAVLSILDAAEGRAAR